MRFSAAAATTETRRARAAFTVHTGRKGHFAERISALIGVCEIASHQYFRKKISCDASAKQNLFNPIGRRGPIGFMRFRVAAVEDKSVPASECEKLIVVDQFQLFDGTLLGTRKPQSFIENGRILSWFFFSPLNIFNCYLLG